MPKIAAPATYTCHYCQQLCVLESVINYMARNVYDTEEIWKCNNCPVRVRYTIFPPYPQLDGKDVWAVCFAVSHNKERYSIQIHYPDQVCVINHVIIGEKSFDQRELARFPFAGEITPDNANTKLQLILTFL
jgi:hypothetical protein